MEIMLLLWEEIHLSISTTLPKRRNYVISSTKSNVGKKEESVIYSDLIKLNYDIVTREHPYDDIWVIGGEQLYTWYINNNLVKDIYVTNVLEDYHCDTFFPEIPNNYKKIGSGDIVVSKENKLRYNIDIYRNNFYNHKNETVKWCDFLKELDKIGYHGII